MTSIQLTEEQRQQIALSWIKDQQKEHEGYKLPLQILLCGAHMAPWAWSDALQYAVNLCSRNYCMSTNQIITGLK